MSKKSRREHNDYKDSASSDGSSDNYETPNKRFRIIETAAEEKRSGRSEEKNDLFYLSPLVVKIQDAEHEWPKVIKSPIKKEQLIRNNRVKMEEVSIESASDAHCDYYRNHKDHFVWTDHLVISCDGIPSKGIYGFNLGERSKLGSFLNDELDVRYPEKFFEVKKVDGMGNGLFAKREISKNQLIGEYTGELITTAERVKRGKTYCEKKDLSYYIFQTCHTNLEIDAQAMGNHTRFINHSCDPNCKVKKVQMCIGSEGRSIPRNFITTRKKINKGDQITLSYGGKSYFQRLGAPCRCKTVKCYRLKSDLKDAASDTDEEDEVRELINKEKMGGHEDLEDLPKLERDDGSDDSDDEDSMEANDGSFW